MQKCTLSYIPEHLKQNGREKIETFSVGEFLYFRCKKEDLNNPYNSISIAELSHNRSGLNNLLCSPRDTLYSILAEENFEVYEDKEVCELKIINLNSDNKYIKEYTQEKNQITYVCIFELLHEPDACMYPHVVFRVTINDCKIDKGDSYKNTISKLTQIRNSLKEELATMIYRKEVSQNA